MDPHSSSQGPVDRREIEESKKRPMPQRAGESSSTQTRPDGPGPPLQGSAGADAAGSGAGAWPWLRAAGDEVGDVPRVAGLWHS